MSQYLAFEEVPAPTLKTKIVNVRSQRHGGLLAQIKWYGPWRCYVLYPEVRTLWNEQCLMDVNSYINRLKAERANRLEDGRRARAS